MTIPFEQINETIDRSWTERLISIIETAPEDDPTADDATDTLAELIDPAFIDRLFGIATDVSRASFVRARALEVICESGLSLEGDELRQWWNSGDLLLQEDALEDCFRTEADYIRPVLQDPLHPLHLNALQAMEIGFDDPEWQSYVVSGLSHFNPEIQELAADLCVWEEPIASTEKLIELANGSDTDIAIQAIRTLEFFHSRASLRALGELVNHDDQERAERAHEAVIELANDFQSEIAKGSLDTWISPVSDVVALHNQIDVSDGFSRSIGDNVVQLPIHGQALASALLDIGGQWAEKMKWLESADWTSETELDRRLLSSVLVSHVDPIVRKKAARILSTWNDVDGLLELAHDKYMMVRRQAIFRLEAVSKSPSIARDVWPLIANNTAGDWHARDALETWMKHADDDPTEQLVDIALNDTRQGLCWDAINKLGSGKAQLLLPLLNRPPAVNWSQHSLLLENLSETDIRPKGLDDFRDVDDLYVASALARFTA